MDPQKSEFLIFVENPPKKCFLCFGIDSALKTIDAQIFFWLVFLKMHKKGIECQKRHKVSTDQVLEFAHRFSEQIASFFAKK